MCCVWRNGKSVSRVFQADAPVEVERCGRSWGRGTNVHGMRTKKERACGAMTETGRTPNATQKLHCIADIHNYAWTISIFKAAKVKGTWRKP